VTCESHGKEALAATENDLIVEIPLVVRVRPVVVQPRAVLVALAIEDVRVAVGIGSVSRAIRFTACLEMRTGCIVHAIINRPAQNTKSFLFEGTSCKSSVESLDRLHAQLACDSMVSGNHDRLMQPN
jgi:hypothetical protein